MGSFLINLTYNNSYYVKGNFPEKTSYGFYDDDDVKLDTRAQKIKSPTYMDFSHIEKSNQPNAKYCVLRSLLVTDIILIHSGYVYLFYPLMVFLRQPLSRLCPSSKHWTRIA